MNSRTIFALSFAMVILQGQVPLKPRNKDLPQAAIDSYFRTEAGMKARKEVQFQINYDHVKKAVTYSWITGGELDRRVQKLANGVKAEFECTSTSNTWPIVFTYRLILHGDSPQILEDFQISSNCKDRGRFYPKLTPRETAVLPVDTRVSGGNLYPGIGAMDPRTLGYPAAFRITFNFMGQERAIKNRHEYIGEIQFVSWCLPAIVPCHGRGMVEFMASGEDDPHFFVAWFRYLKEQAKVDYMRVYGLTLGPGLDTAKASSMEVMDSLLKDLETARKEGWFAKDEDARALVSGLQGIQESVKRGKSREAKARIDQVLNQLTGIQGKAKTEVFSLVECNLRFVASKI